MNLRDGMEKVMSLLVLVLLVSSFGCIMDSSGEDVTKYEIVLDVLCKPENGSVPDTPENMVELSKNLSLNESIQVESVDANVLKFEISNYSDDLNLNFTEEVPLYGNITVLQDKVKIYPKMEFTDKMMDNNFTSDEMIQSKVREIMFLNWSGLIKNVEQIYNVDFVMYAEHSSVVTELGS